MNDNLTDDIQFYRHDATVFQYVDGKHYKICVCCSEAHAHLFIYSALLLTIVETYINDGPGPELLQMAETTLKSLEETKPVPIGDPQ